MAEWRLRVPITKKEEKKRLAFGWLAMSEDEEGNLIVDNDPDGGEEGDVITPGDLEAMAYEFVLESRKGGEMHVRTKADDGEPIATLVESIVTTRDKQEAMGIPPGHVPVGWWVGFKVWDDDVWSKVEDGTYSMFSLGGSGEREVVEV